MAKPTRQSKRATAKQRRDRQDGHREKLWRMIVWASLVAPGLITVSLSELRALPLSERSILWDVLDEAAEARRQEQEQA